MKFLKIKNKGFTLIELLVVIAIIGVLASVVLVSLNTARNKGGDAAVKSNLANLRSQAELYYSDHNQSYISICSDTKFSSGVTAAGSATCIALADTWAVSAPLKTDANTSWCVDSTGKSSLGTANTNTGLCGAAYTGGPNGFDAVGLRWDGADGPRSYWPAATTYCSSLGTGWGLPSMDKLTEFYNLTRSTPSGFVANYYWSSNTVPSTPANAYVVYFNSSGYSSDFGKSSNYFYVRCVR